MKIAILSTPWIAVPPKGYGGTELVVYNLSEGLVKRGHEVMLFATGDSKTSAKLEFFYAKALGNDVNLKRNAYNFLFHIHEFIKKVRGRSFDIVHNNVGQIGMFFFDLLDVPILHTLHGAYYEDLIAPSGFIKEKRETMKKFKNHPFVSISENQRTGILQLNYIKTVYNGIKPEEFSLGKGEGKYLAWLGRITPNKGVDIAIKVAKRLNMPLKIAAFIDPGDREYFEKEIKPICVPPALAVGEITDTKEKSKFLGEAVATLFPIRWHEPFGLVMVESMAVGTPVIAFNKGSASEVIENGKTGFIVETEKEMAQAVKKIGSIDRNYCREYAISKFSVDRMVDDYLEAYEIAIKQFQSK